MKREAMNLKESKKGYIGGFGERQWKGIIILSPKINNENIFTVKDLCNITIQKLESISGISDISAWRLVDVLKINGLYLKQK